MASQGRHAMGILESLRTAAVTLASAIALAVILVGTATAQGPTFKVIFSFTGGTDGANPMATVTADRLGHLYGTASQGGINGYGTVVRLKKAGSGWATTPLYSFMGGNSGGYPVDAVTIGADGSIYGPSPTPGAENYGIVFNLKPGPRPPTSIFGGWTEFVLYTFTGLHNDGAGPQGAVVFDQGGNLYGTTESDGVCGHGTVYELIRSNKTWTLSLLHVFCSSGDAELPESGVIFDTKGNLYGTTYGGGQFGFGTAFQLTPSGSGWTENILYSFSGGADGGLPSGGLVFDQSGNLYGTTSQGGKNNGGTVFMLTPSNGSWDLTTLYSFTAANLDGNSGNLVLDSAGNLYGTRKYEGVYGKGAAFKLTRSNGSWTYSSLHDFTGGGDGAYPLDGLIFNTNGNLYGTAYGSGSYSNGVIYEITP